MARDRNESDGYYHEMDGSEQLDAHLEARLPAYIREGMEERKRFLATSSKAAPIERALLAAE